MRIKIFPLFIIIILFSYMFFAMKAHGIVEAPIVPPSKSDSLRQLIVVFRPNQNPQQIEKSYQEKQRLSKTFGGKIKMFFSELSGKIPGDLYYERQLKAIAEVEKKAQVVSSENLYPPKPDQPTTQLITLKKQANVNNAIKLYLTLSQVETAAPNSIKTVQSISETAAPNPYERAQHEIIVQYKEGATPNDIANAVNERAKIASQPVIGSLRIAADNALDLIQGSQTPEDLQQEYAKTKEEAGVLTANELIPKTEKPTPLENAEVIKISEQNSITNAIDVFKKLSTVELAVPNSVKTSVAIPNDPGFSRQWDMPKIQAPEAWNISKGSSNVKVAVIDSGVDYNHQDLKENVIKGKNFIPGGDPNDPMDDCGHGTHVAGTIGAITNNSIGVAGINWNVKVLAVKTLGPYMGNCAGNDSSVIQGIHSAVDEGAKVINMSLGAEGACGIYQEAVDYARNAGATVVIAAGNNSTDASVFSPANCRGVITVGATDPSDGRASYSNYGSVIAIAAPGGDRPCETNCIYSTYPNNQYKMMAGTSMASPHVAGAAGLLLSLNPGLSPDEVKNILVSNADPISTNPYIGPRLNLARAVQAVAGENPTPTPTQAEPTPTPTPTPEVSTPTPTPTQRPGVPTPTETPVIEEPTPTLQVNKGIFTVSVNIPGIGPGENINPTPSSKPAIVEFIDRNGNVVERKNITLLFQNSSFDSSILLDNIASGTYQLRIKVPGTLPRFIRGFYTVDSNTNTLILPTASLISGDINQDGILDLLDYNILISHIQNNTQSAVSDLNSDGKVTPADLNIFLRQLSNRAGD